MKRFETEKNNIPEGATHYCEQNGVICFVWIKEVGGKLMVWVPQSHNYWHEASVFCNHYRKTMKPIPKSEVVEWNGEGLPPVGCKIKTKHGVSEVLSTSDWDGGVVTYSYDEGMSIACAWNNKSWINPIETEKQRKERERLEAAYDLYSSWVSNSYGEPLFCFKAFCDTPELCTKWLSIVDKTNYRKGE